MDNELKNMYLDDLSRVVIYAAVLILVLIKKD